MSFSKRQIAGEHYLGRTGSFSTRPHRNGRVEVLPPGAVEIETLCESLEDARNHLIEAQVRNIDLIAAKSSDRKRLIEQNKVISGMLSRINWARKGKGTFQQAFQVAAEVMLSEAAQIKAANAQLQDSEWELLSEAAGKAMATAEQICEGLAAASVTVIARHPDSAELIRQMIRCSVRNRDEMRSYGVAAESLAKSESFYRACRKVLRPETVECIERCASKRTTSACVKSVVAAAGGKRSFKKLAGISGEGDQ